ncbi:PREDICTED: probable xyloglucan endotransglucosylase/hydrolase protein 30 [Nelumbo nucifera]|uniref:Xyloglucan endotransglucosylase/hydrolase n=1 Tax=Nelumbo nucifera TaxID=4432 RepID=A0A1U8BIF8_NELNU|nr:PREDICTED: probable xyloglucan endotransglucosylase/hydrolase protein 30 [Nelumbo nucifera]
MNRLRSSSLSRTLTHISFFLCISFVAAAAGFNLTTIGFDEGYTPLFGDFNILRSSDGKSVSLLLNRYSGSGFISSSLYNHGFFSAKIKLPSDYTAGVVVAFYTSNADVFEKTHDELDFEFLGNVQGKEWRFQTNVYGNGSTNRGREERYTLWFDPTREFHRYSILWTAKNIIFYVDEVPIREVVRSDAMGGDYPSKPMALYATIWDASNWATAGGKYKVNYKYAPFVSDFSDLVLQGCQSDPIQEFSSTICADEDAELERAEYAVITPERRRAMRVFRQKYMYYSYCYDILRYPVPPPECVITPSERRRFKDTGRVKFGSRRRRRSRRPSRLPAGGNQADV